MISGINHVVGTFTITDETIINIPNGNKILFTVDDIARLFISINDNQNYMEYRNVDGPIEFADNLTKLYVKRSEIDISVGNIGKMRVWTKI